MEENIVFPFRKEITYETWKSSMEECFSNIKHELKYCKSTLSKYRKRLEKTSGDVLDLVKELESLNNKSQALEENYEISAMILNSSLGDAIENLENIKSESLKVLGDGNEYGEAIGKVSEKMIRKLYLMSEIKSVEQSYAGKLAILNSELQEHAYVLNSLGDQEDYNFFYDGDMVPCFTFVGKTAKKAFADDNDYRKDFI